MLKKYFLGSLFKAEYYQISVAIRIDKVIIKLFS